MEVYMRNVKIRFVDFWDNQNHCDAFFYKLLSEKFDLVISDEPDYIVYSVYGYEHLKYECIKIFYTPEQCSPDFDMCDYAIGFDYLSYNDRYVRIPYFAILYNADDLKRIEKIDFDEKRSFSDRQTCSFVYSNSKANSMRDEIFFTLNKHIKILSGGRLHNNIGYRISNKLEFLKGFKFDLSIENGSYPGYVTEKIMDAFAAGIVPIYYGDPLIEKDFNPNSFINLMNFSDLEQAATYIASVESNETIYDSYINAPKFKEIVHTYRYKFFEFFEFIFSQELDKAKRRPRTYFSNYKKRELFFNYIIFKYIINPLIRIKRIIRR
jgi:hypothetical protein